MLIGSAPIGSLAIAEPPRLTSGGGGSGTGIAGGLTIIDSLTNKRTIG